MTMLKRLQLRRFKGFREFSLVFGEDALLIGPNNAGKSTLIGALRLCSEATKLAMSAKAVTAFVDGERHVRGYAAAPLMGSAGFTNENIRYEFQEAEARLDLTFSTGAVLHMVWPVSSDAFFWVEHPSGIQVVTAAKAKAALCRIGLVPTLTPLEHEERQLRPKHVRANLETRLASRHFRNQVALSFEESEERYESLIGFLLENTPELISLELSKSPGDDGTPWLDLFYRDSGSRVEKEIYWAGDGLQIWLQVLYHMWRNQDRGTLVLDEPDVFLHPDLQRRLVRVLEASGKQTIMATHAPEMATEARQSSVVWIERGRRAAKRVSEDQAFAQVSSVLGSAFNLAIARALRAKIALFVEGKDMKILHLLARKLKAEALAGERGLAVIPMGGFTHWPSVEAFAWLKDQLLGAAVGVHVILDRDYRSVSAISALESEMSAKGIAAHVWRRKELESYLLELSVLSRVAGVEESVMVDALLGATGGMRGAVCGQYVKTAIEEKQKHVDIATASSEAISAFDTDWAVLNRRLAMTPAKDVISAWNGAARQFGGAVVTPRKLANAIRLDELDAEVQEALLVVERSLS